MCTRLEAKCTELREFKGWARPGSWEDFMFELWRAALVSISLYPSDVLPSGGWEGALAQLVVEEALLTQSRP